jgi:hypothetical protein
MLLICCWFRTVNYGNAWLITNSYFEATVGLLIGRLIVTAVMHAAAIN